MKIDYEIKELIVKGKITTARFAFSMDEENVWNLKLEVDSETKIPELKRQAVSYFTEEVGKEIDLSTAQFEFRA